VIQPPGTQGAPQQNQNKFPSIWHSLPRQQCQPAFCPTEVPHRLLECPAKSNPNLPEPQVLAAEVVVRTQKVNCRKNCETQPTSNSHPGRTTTRSQLQEDINAILQRAFLRCPRSRRIPGRAGDLVVQPNRFYVTSSASQCRYKRPIGATRGRRG